MSSTFNPEMLILARESRELTQAGLAEVAGVRQPAISKVEGGLLSPSQELLHLLAAKLEYPVEFFYQSDHVYGFNSTVFFHRKRKALSEKTLRRLHAQMNLSRMRVSRLSRSIVSNEGKFKHTDVGEFEGGAQSIAQITRSTWLMPPGPIRSVTAAIESAGGYVIHTDFGTRQIDGISEWVSGYAPLFLINTHAEMPWDRIRLTLAHELGHVLMHTFPSPEMENEANSFAAEFLMPRKEIKPYLYGLTLAKLQDLKRTWKVSMQALIKRAFDLGTISEQQQKLYFMNLAKRGYRVHEPLENEYAPERGELVDRMVSIHQEKLGYSPDEVARLMLIDRDEFRLQFLGERKLRLVG